MTERGPLDFFRGDGARREEPVVVSTTVLTDEALAQQARPEGYRLVGESAQSVVTAVNVALALRTPLLVTGEPGSGKTQLAYAVAHELGRPAPLKFVTKSTSQSRDLLYTYDAVQHFRASQAGAGADARDYIEYSGLGLAILLGLPIEARRRFLSPAVFDAEHDVDLPPDRRAVRRLLRQDRERQLVLLIDEIDKAPRDFPNDLLDELENMTFRVPELNGLETPQPAPSLRPIVIITSNAERPLPEAFLRRCVYIHLPCPTGEALEAILESRLSAVFAAGAPLVRDIQAFFEAVRASEVLDKSPGVAELIQFLQAVSISRPPATARLAEMTGEVVRCLPVLGKSRADQDALADFLRTWRGPEVGGRNA